MNRKKWKEVLQKEFVAYKMQKEKRTVIRSRKISEAKTNRREKKERI
jgi:hypothetical protein